MAVTNKVLEVPSSCAPSHGVSFHRMPMKPSDYCKYGAVAAWLSPTGQQRSLPTNVRAIPARVNCNSLRSRRVPRFADTLASGGATYRPEVCVDNWAEDRADRSYTPPAVPALMRTAGAYAYKTEYMQRTREALPQYRERMIAEGGLAAKVPTTAPAGAARARSGTAAGGDYVHYARDSFARGVSAAHADATTSRKQGCAWVGTAPCHLFKSVAATAQAGLKPEFQKMHPSADGKMKCVMTCNPQGQPTPSAALEATTRRFAESEKSHAARWRTTYQTAMYTGA